MQANTHNRQISIAKGIGISLMVLGHSGCPDYLHNFIYCFHMVLFYYLSGFFFRDQKILDNARAYLWRKIRGLYWPYIKWSIIFILLHNFFYEIGFNDDYLSNQDIFVNIKRACRGYYQGEHFLGAYWFLMSLLRVILLFSAIIWLKHQLKIEIFDRIAVLCLFLIGVVSNELGFYLGIQRELMILPFFYMGYIMNKYNFTFTRLYKIISFCLCFPILLILSLFVSIEIGQNEFGPYYIYILSSLCGIFWVMALSEILAKEKIGAIFDRIGCVTLSIMTFHFLGFKILSAILIRIMGLSSCLLRVWPMPIELKSYWLLYFLVGLAFPVCILLLGEKIKTLIVLFFIHK